VSGDLPVKAVYIAEPGGPEKLIFGDRPDPEAGPGEVIVRVRATALNHADLAIRAGRSATGGLPRILGLDIAGEVAHLGSGVTGFRAGDRVVVENRVKCGACTPCAHGRDEFCERQKRLGGELDGGHAQYCKVPAVNLQRIPDRMGFEEAATFPLAGHTAWHCLIERVQLQPWEDILIQAVGSGVGSLGLLIAKGIGARVIATAGSDWKLEKAKELGADEVINYTTTPKFSQRVKELTDGRGVDVVFDCVGASVWDESLASLKPGGRLVITGTTSGSQIPFNLSVMQSRPLTLMGSGARSRRSFTAMMHMVHYGGLRGVVGQTFDLGDCAKAHGVMAGRDFFGKLVLRVP
jgi:NADPH:quinone reductase-like Zn-dependent oxidoreductase